MEDGKEIPLKTSNKTTIWLSNPTPNHIPKETRVEKEQMYPIAHCSTIYNS